MLQNSPNPVMELEFLIFYHRKMRTLVIIVSLVTQHKIALAACQHILKLVYNLQKTKTFDLLTECLSKSLNLIENYVNFTIYSGFFVKLKLSELF